MEKQLYELAYHIEPSVQEDQLLAMKVDLERLITANSGAIVFSKDPERGRLSYPIRHEWTSYFGYFHFTVEDNDGIAHIDEQLRLNTRIMRHLIIKIEDRRAVASKVPSVPTMKPVKKETAVRQDGKEIEKQLDDVISGL